MEKTSKIAWWLGVVGSVVAAIGVGLLLAAFLPPGYWRTGLAALPLLLFAGTVRIMAPPAKTKVFLASTPDIAPFDPAKIVDFSSFITGLQPAAPAPARSGGDEEWVQQQIKNLAPGSMEIDAPKTARIGVRQECRVVINHGISQAVLGKIAEGRQVRIEQIKLGSFMRVTLTGEAFRIEAPDIIDKLVAEDTPATWVFGITPRLQGTQKLVVKAIVRIHMPNGGIQEYYELPEQQCTIDVKVNPVYVFRRFLAIRFMKFALSACTAAVAVGGYIFGLDPVRAKVWDLLTSVAAHL